MIDFEPTPEQIEFRDTVAEFARAELNHELTDRDRDHVFSPTLWKRCAEIGLVGLTIDPQWGGQGADPITAALALEAFGYGCRDNGLTFSLGAHLWSAATPIERFGTEEQKTRWLPGLCDGSLVGVQGMSEPDSGSDAFSLRTTAVADGSDWVLNGAKTWTTNAPIADVFVVFATIDADKGWSGLSAFLVERDRAGLTVGAPFRKMGLHTSPMSELYFDDCRVPDDNVLGAIGAGSMIFGHSMDWERSMILAPAVGTMQRQVEECAEYAKTRQQFGAPISKFQAVSHRIVDMRVRVETARMLLYRMAWLKSRGKPTAVESSMVKLCVSEAWVESSLDQIQIHGALGYMAEAGYERELRDAIGSRIYSGTSDIQKNLIARHMRL